MIEAGMTLYDWGTLFLRELQSIKVSSMMWTVCLLLLEAVAAAIGFVIDPGKPSARNKKEEVFLDEGAANTFMTRKLKYNSWDFEMFTPGNLERECREEICNYEEARECFEDDKTTKQFWDTYEHNGKGGSSSSPAVDVAGLVAGLIGGLVLLVMAGAVILYCVRYRAKEAARTRPPVNLTSNLPLPEQLPLTHLPVPPPTAPGLPSYEEALEASGTHDGPPPPYQSGSTRYSSQPS
uniref:Gla domain-containing protein n=1 Tax=Leptobrachium leishanense TaxID=445787 RepID=A0A8C5QI81_9ANUR